MKANYLLVCVFTIMICCNSKINQYEKIGNRQQRVGKWIEKDKSEDDDYLAKGKYRRGEKTGVWRTYFNGQLYQKDKIKDSVTKSRVYFQNGKLMENGESKMIVTDSSRHWFLSGKWNYYDEKGKIKYSKIYRDGKKLDSISYTDD